jgi:hypothetical protein
MLWPVIKPTHSSLYWLDDVHKSFYRLMFQGEEFAKCFPQEFQNVLNESGKTNQYFADVFEKYSELTAPHKAFFIQIYNQQIAILPAYSDNGIQLLKPNIKKPNTLEHKALWKACKALGGYLYATTLGLTCFSNSLVQKFGVVALGNMHEHYLEFKRLNSGICSFCGLSPMTAEVLVEPEGGAELEEEKQRRASYDHYLPKAHYPFLAVDFSNLIPCCDTCNEDFKAELDALQHGAERSLAFIPYSQEQVMLTADYVKTPGDFYKIRVSIANTGCDIERKGKTWDRIFKVTGRVNHILDQSFIEEWLAPLLADVTDTDTAKHKLRRESDRFQARIKKSKEAYYKALSFRCLSGSEDEVMEDLLTTVEEIYSPRAGAL